MIDGMIGKIRSTVVRALQHIHISFAGLDFDFCQNCRADAT